MTRQAYWNARNANRCTCRLAIPGVLPDRIDPDCPEHGDELTREGRSIVENDAIRAEHRELYARGAEVLAGRSAKTLADALEEILCELEHILNTSFPDSICASDLVRVQRMALHALGRAR
jgi:hypothetical protein